MLPERGLRIGASTLIGVLTLICGGPDWAAAAPGARAKPAQAPEKQQQPVAAQPEPPPLTPGFSVKPSDVVLPPDVPIGQYARTTRPFPNWTLICDDDLSKKTRVCNISQTMVDASGSMVFSWSLAATQGGQPYFILRTPPVIQQGGAIQLDVGASGDKVSVPVTGCDGKVCVAYLPVGPHLRAAIAKGLAVEVSYPSTAPTGAPTFRVPLYGLTKALAAI